MIKFIPKTAILFVFMLLSLSVFSQVTYYVSPGGNDDNAGTSWATAKQTVQAAVNAASSGNRVFVKQGHYILSAQLTMKQGVNVYGGFAGTESSPEQRPALTYGQTAGGQASVLDANTSIGGSSRRVLDQPTVFITETTWDGFIMQNGYADEGGGVYLWAGGAISNCAVINNACSSLGGGVYCASGGTITHCAINNNTNNSSDAASGGVYCSSGTTITNSTISGNTGGGVRCNQGGTLTDCTISGNTNGYSGGGVDCYQGGTVTDCIIANNKCRFGGGGIDCFRGGVVTGCIITGNMSNTGGGVRLYYGGSVTGCTITNNTSERNGGGVYSFNGGTLIDCFINNNTSGFNGGGAYCEQQRGTLISGTLINCVITNNTCNNTGGGVCCLYGGTLINSTIANNMCVSYGGGICLSEGGILTNCAVWGNKKGSAFEQIYTVGTTYSIIRSAIQGGYAGEANINLEAANTGAGAGLFYPAFTGPTGFAGRATNTADSLAVIAADWRITAASGCKDKGDNSVIASRDDILADIAGNARIRNCMIDIGAYEVQEGDAYQTLNIASLLTGLEYGGTAVTLPAVTNEGVRVTYTSSDPGIASITGNTLNIINSGVFGLTAEALATGYCDYRQTLEVVITNNIPIQISGPAIYVKPRDTGLADGSSWENATANLQAAVNAAATVSGRKPQVWAAQGRYTFATELTMKEGVNVYGGFVGIESSLEQRPVLTHGKTAGGQASVLDAGASTIKLRRVLNQLLSFTVETVWDGFVLQNGYTNGNGGGVILQAGGMLFNCTVTGNTGFQGGGVYCFKGGMLANCAISNNQTIMNNSRGGGVYSDQGGTFVNCTINNNQTIMNNSRGGGVYCSFGGTFINCAINNNQATGDYSVGGGVYCIQGSTFTNCVIWGNENENSIEQVYTAGVAPVITWSAVQGGYTGEGNINLESANTGSGTGLFYPAFTGPTGFAGTAGSAADSLAIIASDWSITAASACIDAGIVDTTGLNLPKTDLAGNPRISNGRIDIGAYEYGTLQTITWNQTFGEYTVYSNPFALTASASSGLPVTYTSSNSNVATVSGNTLSVTGGGTAVISAVQAGNGTYFPAVMEKNITVLSNDATPASLTVSAGTLTPEFDAAETSYTVSVEGNVGSITIGAAANHPGATVTGTGEKPLTAGSNPFNIVITAEDRITTKTYTVTVTRAISTDATLAGLTVSEGTLTPAFDAGTVSYTVTVANSVESITIGAVANHPLATVTGTGEKPLTVGDNPFSIVVTAENGTTKTYTVTVSRALSADATLSGLTVSEGTLTPAFDAGTVSYTVTVANSVERITIGAVANHPQATVTGTGEKPLTVGANPFDIVVTAEDGTAKTYTVTVKRMSNDATLSNLTISAGSLTPAFNAAETSYTVTVESSIVSITIGATANHPQATVTGTGEKPLPAGDNPFDVVVTAEDGTTNTYTVTVTRAPSTDATLSSLGVSEISINPRFDPNIENYTTAVENYIDFVVIHATANHPGATVTGTGEKSLRVGDTPFDIVVTAEDGITTKTYTVIVFRGPGTDATLADLTVSEGTLTPAFDANTLSYTVEVENSVESITIDATVNHPEATVIGTGEKTLTVGDNPFEIVVTAELSIITKKYTITVTRAPYVSLVNNIEQAALKVYPNPVARGGEVYLDLADDKTVEVSLYDLLGKRIYSQKTTGKQAITMPENEGVYVLIVNNRTVKVVVY